MFAGASKRILSRAGWGLMLVGTLGAAVQTQSETIAGAQDAWWQVGQWILLLALMILAVDLFTRHMRRKNQELEAVLHAKASELEETRESLKDLTLKDSLTGLPGRRLLESTLKEDLSLSMRAHHDLASGSTASGTNIDMVFLKVEVDRFHENLEIHGPAIGNQILLQIKRILESATRGSDSVIRWEDKEFMVVARNTDRNQIQIVAERIRRHVEQRSFEIAEGRYLSCTCSIGCSAFPLLPSEPEAYTWEQTLELAECCLKAAIASGRNAWVGILAPASATAANLGTEPERHLADLIRAEKLDLITSLSSKDSVCWPAAIQGLSNSPIGS